jgi:hypothetical protein
MIAPDQSESLEWLDFMLELTGANKQLANLLDKMKPEMEEFEQKVWPAVEKLREKEKQWEKLKASLDGRQREELRQKGFVPLEEWQKVRRQEKGFRIGMGGRWE